VSKSSFRAAPEMKHWRAWGYGAAATLLISACGGSSPTSPSSRLQVTFTSQAPDRCTSACLRVAWVDQSSASQGLLRIAIQVQGIPTRGISSVSNILSGWKEGTFSDPSSALVFSASAPGDFFERLGKPVRYEASDIGTALSNCCLTTYSAGFPNPAATDRVSGEGTIVVLTYKLRQAGTVDIDPGLGILGDILVTTFGATVRITGS
jgi:hypothetical protein